MEDRKYKVDLYLYDRPLIINPIEFYQNDTESCAIEFNFNTDRVNKFDLTNKTVEVRVTKPDLTTITDSATITGLNTAVWELKLGAISVSGSCSISIYVYQNTERLTFGTLKYKVIADREVGNVGSQPEYPILTKLIADTQAAVNESNQTNDNISVMEQQRQQAETTRNSEFNTMKSEYGSIKGIMVDSNNAANLQAQILALANGGPKNVFTTLSLLETDTTANTTEGKKYIYIVINPVGDGKDYWYYWNGSAWTKGNVFQNTGLANGSVTREVLADVFSLGNDLATGTDLNTVTSEGNFSGVGNGGYLNLPPSFPTTRSFVLNVTPIFKGNNRFKIHTLIDYIEPHKQYVRRLDTLTPASSSAWVMNGSYNAPSSITETEIANNSIGNAKYKAKSIDNSKLFDNILTKPNLTTGTDLNTLILEGRHLGLGTDAFTNIHDSFIGKSFLLDVKAYGTSGGFYIQHMTEYFKPEHQMVRFVQKTASTTVTPWSNVINQSSSSRLAGKTIVCFGDSITEGTTSNKYPDLIAQYLGATVINVGFGGCQMAKHMNTQAGNWYDEMGMYKLANAIATNNFTALESAAINLRDTYGDDNTAIVARLKAINWNTVDYVTIKYGQNDYASNIVPIGTNADADGTTFKGAINYSIEKLLTAYPHLKIAFITPYWRGRLLSGDGKESDTNPNTNGNYLIEYVDAIIERANAHHLPALDLYREGGINKYNGTTYQTDGLHPTPAGYELIAKKISAFLEAKF